MDVAIASASASAPVSGAAPGWQEASVVEVVDEGPDAVTLRLRLSEPTGFLAGQYFNVRWPVPGRPRPVQRAYSVASSPVPDPSVIDLGVREVPGGLVSPHMVRDLGPGHPVSVRGPYGRFTWREAEARPVLLVGAGSGLVPLMSMVRYAHARGRRETVWLVCSAATYAHAFYRDELERLATGRSWLRVVHCITRDPAERRAAYHRRIDGDVLREVLDGAVPALSYLCGPPAMVDAVSAALHDLGVDPGAVLSEKYD